MYNNRWASRNTALTVKANTAITQHDGKWRQTCDQNTVNLQQYNKIWQRSRDRTQYGVKLMRRRSHDRTKYGANLMRQRSRDRTKYGANLMRQRPRDRFNYESKLMRHRSRNQTLSDRPLKVDHNLCLGRDTQKAETAPRPPRCPPPRPAQCTK